jgi:hypothetical protein
MTTDASSAHAFSCEPAATPEEIAAIAAVLQLANAGGQEASAGEKKGASRWRLAARREATGRAEIAAGPRS